MTCPCIYDIIIIGSGPAAYQAAIYTQDVKVLVLEGGIIGNNGAGGQLTTTTLVNNHPGFPEGIDGPEFMIKMKEQAKHENITFKEETVTDVTQKGPNFTLKTEECEYLAKTVIIATGAQAKRLEAKGTAEFWQKGISSCAVCDGFLYVDKKVAVIGGGDSAMEESLHLSSIASEVILLHRRDDFRSRRDMLERVEKNKKIKIMRSFVLEEAKGDEYLTRIVVKDVKTGKNQEIQVDGLFFAIGHTPNTSFISDDLLDKDKYGYLIVDKDMKTHKPGIFACGDVQDKIYRQANTAAATGCLAGISALNYLKNK